MTQLFGGIIPPLPPVPGDRRWGKLSIFLIVDSTQCAECTGRNVFLKFCVIEEKKFFVKLFWCLFKIHQEVDSPVYSSQGSQDSPVYSPLGSGDSLVYSSLGEWFWTPGVVLPIWVSIVQQPLKWLSSYKLTVGYFNCLGTWDICSKKIPFPRHFYRLPGAFITGESITN